MEDINYMKILKSWNGGEFKIEDTDNNVTLEDVLDNNLKKGEFIELYGRTGKGTSYIDKE